MYIKEFQMMINNTMFHAFIVVILLDILTGTTKGFVSKKASSLVGLSGMLKHIMNVVIVILMYPLLTKLEMENYAKIITLFYITFYALSNIENLAVIGVPFPKWVKNAIEVLHKNTDEKGE